VSFKSSLLVNAQYKRNENALRMIQKEKDHPGTLKPTKSKLYTYSFLTILASNTVIANPMTSIVKRTQR
jgi:hypothetical protein